MVKPGDRVKDKITGFEGIVTARVEHLYGCIRLAVQPEQVDKDGKLIDTYYFDEPQLEVVEAGVIEPEMGVVVREVAKAPKHGPREDPPKREM